MYLTNMTGNRRYPIIVCHNKARHYVEIPDGYIEQVWAEVFAHYNELFKDGFNEKKLELSRDSQIQSDEIAEDYLRDDGMESEIRAHLDTKILPLILWFLLTREERRDFHKNGRFVMIDALSEFTHRRRARGGKDATVQRDVDLISSCLAPEQNKHWLGIETIQMHVRHVDEWSEENFCGKCGKRRPQVSIKIFKQVVCDAESQKKKAPTEFKAKIMEVWKSTRFKIC